MNPSHCEREPQILEAIQNDAIRNGNASPDLLAHAETCPVCSEVWLVAELLQGKTQDDSKLEEISLADHELTTLPDPGLIWRKAQARARAGARERALAKATLPIRIMRTCAVVVVILALPWLASLFAHPPAWITEFHLNSFSLIHPSSAHLSWIDQGGIGQNWLGALTGTTLVGLSVTVACIALGSWYMLREK
jgi:hypothetical protein